MNATSALDSFIGVTERYPAESHESLLIKAYQLIKEELVQTRFAVEKVRLAHRIFGYLGDDGIRERVTLLRNYLQYASDAPPNERFWANWELVDSLALLKQNKEMLQEQQELLLWCKHMLSPDYWIQVMYDSTQAIGWIHENQAQAWFKIYYDFIHYIEPTATNRRNRVLYIETAVGMLVFYLHQYEDALNEIARYRSVLHEDASWEEFNRFNVRLTSYELGLYSAQGDWIRYNNTAERVIADIGARISKYKQKKSCDVEELCDMAHEIGTCLMWEQHYLQAMPLYEFALDHQGTGLTHFFYSVCVWATTKNKDETLRHLQLSEWKVKGNGGLRSRYIHMFKEQPEFEDVQDDEQFLAIFTE